MPPDYPVAADVEIGEDRIAVVYINRPRAYYSRGGTVDLAAGQTEVVVAFATPLKDSNWVFGGLTFWNSADADIDVPFLATVSRLAKSQNGFTLLLSAPPPTANHKLDWTIAEKTE